MVSHTTVDRYLEVIFEAFKAPISWWWTPKALPTIAVDKYLFYVYVCNFEIWHHLFRMVEGRGDAPSTSGITLQSYSQKTSYIPFCG